MRTRSLLLEAFRLAHWLLRRLLELLFLLARSEQRKEVEILLLRRATDRTTTVSVPETRFAARGCFGLGNS
jgi:hypothetical protein